MRRSLSVVVLLVGMAVTGALVVGAQAPPAAAPAAPPAPLVLTGPISVLTFVDITPDNKDKGTAFAKQYAADTRKDPGVTRVDLLWQSNRMNHLFIYEVWQSQKAFEAHESLAHVKDFRAKMQPLLGSPFDQRIHQMVP
jgi:quinol monooxygenase YgiN